MSSGNAVWVAGRVELEEAEKEEREGRAGEELVGRLVDDDVLGTVGFDVTAGLVVVGLEDEEDEVEEEGGLTELPATREEEDGREAEEAVEVVLALEEEEKEGLAEGLAAGFLGGYISYACKRVGECLVMWWWN